MLISRKYNILDQDQTTMQKNENVQLHWSLLSVKNCILFWSLGKKAIGRDTQESDRNVADRDYWVTPSVETEGGKVPQES